MDGIDFTSIDEVDQGMFDVSPWDSDDEDDDSFIPDLIGIDSALQDDEKSRLESLNSCQTRNKSREERELEVQMLAPGSIRREILERSINKGNRLAAETSTNDSTAQGAPDSNPTSHVMNITEKAGMSGIDKDRINRIIHEVSKGSLFYKRQAERQSSIHATISKMLGRVEAATPVQLDNGRALCDKIIRQLEDQRTFNKVIVHFDLDMFYAAVEIRDDPELATKPMAVGSDSMLSTSNYIARQYGVRAAMPGFIARKLCPQLVIVPANGDKYRAASAEVFSVLQQYDPNFSHVSLDEAYLDLTDYIRDSLQRDGLETQEHYDGTLPKVWWTRASEVVEEIRVSVFGRTKLTCSAGIACNAMLAKISTDMNKPDGQFMVQGYPKDVMDFVGSTPVGKVSGIGKVTVQFLNALEINTCSDILVKRQFLPIVFLDVNLRFYLSAALGIGSTSAKIEAERKSRSAERTFAATRDQLELLERLDSVCQHLYLKYLKSYKVQGRTVTLKIKRNTFVTTTKSYSLLVPTGDKDVIYSTAKNLLLAELANEPPDVTYRLLGVKLSNLADDEIASNQLTIDAMFRNQALSSPSRSEQTVFQAAGESIQEATNKTLASELEPALQGQAASKAEPNAPSTPRPASSASSTGSPRDHRIESFFPKALVSSSTGSRSPRNSSNPSEPCKGISRIDVPCSSSSEAPTVTPDVVLHDQIQGESADEKLPCPFCLKLFAPFSVLEAHVGTCRYKTTIDVNKSFFSTQRTTISQHTAAKSQVGGPTKHATKTAKGRRRSSIADYLKVHATQPSTDLNRVNILNNPTSPKLSFYQQFLESNSKSLSKAKENEPWRCIYCCHGFLQFSLLEAHAKICTRRISK